jgi:hypothetical protein
MRPLFTLKRILCIVEIVSMFSIWMNLPAASGGVSCPRCIVFEVRSVRKLFNCGAYYHFFVGVANSNRPKGRGIKPHCE